MRIGIADRQVEDRRIDQPDHIQRRLPDMGAREREHIPKSWPAFCCIFAFGRDTQSLAGILLVQADRHAIALRPIIAGDEQIGSPVCLARDRLRDVQSDRAGQRHASLATDPAKRVISGLTICVVASPGRGRAGRPSTRTTGSFACAPASDRRRPVRPSSMGWCGKRSRMAAKAAPDRGQAGSVRTVGEGGVSPSGSNVSAPATPLRWSASGSSPPKKGRRHDDRKFPVATAASEAAGVRLRDRASPHNRQRTGRHADPAPDNPRSARPTTRSNGVRSWRFDIDMQAVAQRRQRRQCLAQLQRRLACLQFDDEADADTRRPGQFILTQARTFARDTDSGAERLCGGQCNHIPDRDT